MSGYLTRPFPKEFLRFGSLEVAKGTRHHIPRLLCQILVSELRRKIITQQTPDIIPLVLALNPAILPPQLPIFTIQAIPLLPLMLPHKFQFLSLLLRFDLKSSPLLLHHGSVKFTRFNFIPNLLPILSLLNTRPSLADRVPIRAAVLYLLSSPIDIDL